MEHDRRTCPRCGEPAGDHGFCQSCRSHIDSLTGIPTRAGAQASDPSYLAAQVLRLEQALAAASKGISDRTSVRASSTAVELEPDPPSADDRTADASIAAVDIGERASSVDTRLRDGRQQRPEVARLEDVLTVKPKQDPEQHVVEIAPVLTPEVEDTPADTVPEANPTPVADPIYVAAHLLREAFWFELASASRPRGTDAPLSIPPPPAQIAASIPPPEPVQAETTHPAEHYHPQSVDHVLVYETPRSRSATAICLLSLFGLVALLIGRSLGRRPR